MDRRERTNDPQIALLVALRGFQANLWTSLPGIVQSFDAVKMTMVVQPSIQAQVRSSDGVWSNVNLPLLVDCPVIFPSGGGYTLTFPIAPGDEVLAVFASRCIDGWWQSGQVQPQSEIRMHDLSDGFCIPGPFSQPHVLSGVSTNSTQLRNKDGTIFVEVAAAQINLHGNVHVTGTLNVASTLDVQGVTTTKNITATGKIDATLGVRAGVGGADQVTLQGHIHQGVTRGGQNSDQAVAGT